MATAEAIRLHDVVELRVDCGRWPSGTIGTIVESFDRGIIVEIADEHGHTLDMLSLPYVAVRSCPSDEQTQLAV